MQNDLRDDSDWRTLLSFVPVDVDAVAVRTRSLVRRREIRTGGDLLRLALVYADDEMSLRETSAWARERGVAQFSDVAVLKRLRSSVPFLREILNSLLTPVRIKGEGLCLKILDATTIRRSVSPGTDFRVHLCYDLARGEVAGIELTSDKEGERLDRAGAGPGDLLIADQGYPAREPLSGVVNSGAKVLIRVNASHLPVNDEDGAKIKLLEAVAGLEVGDILDIPVWTVPTKSAPSISGRIVALRKSEADTAKELERRTKKAKKNGVEVGPESEAAAAYVFIFTTLSLEQASGEEVLDIYRLRWQIEMYFKRIKGIVSLGETPAKDLVLCEAVILAKLITIMLVQAHESAFFPWGYPIRTAQSLANS